MGFANLWPGFGLGGAAKRDLSNLTAHPNADKHALFLRGDGTFAAGALVYKGGVAGASVPATSTVAGDCYSITAAGTSQGETWVAGDLAIYEGTSGNWTRVPLGFATGVSVDSYGAVGDGVTDDTTAINSAITAAGPGRIVYFTDGKTYLTTSAITIPTNYITLMGYGATITSALDTQFRKFLFSSRTRGAVRGLKFDCIYTSASKTIGAGVVEIANSTDIDVIDCEFNEVAQSGVYIVGTSSRVQILRNQFYKNFCAIFSDDDTVNQPTFVKVIGNHFRTGLGTATTSFSGAIKFSGTGNTNSYAGHVFTDNTIDACGEMGIELQGWVNGCVIGDNTIRYTGFGVSLSNVADIGVSGNTIRGCTDYGIEVADSERVAIAGGQVNGVNAVGTRDTQYCIIVNNSDFVSVGGGIQLANSTDQEVNVVASSHVFVSGCVTYGKGYNVKDSTRVSIDGNDHFATNSAGYWIFVDSTDGDVSQLRIAGNTVAGSVSANGILLYHPAHVIEDVGIFNNITSGFSTAGGGLSDSGGGTLRRVRTGGNIADGDQNWQTALGVEVWADTASRSLSYFEVDLVLIDATSGALVQTLPTAVGISGRSYTVVKTDASTNTVSLATTSAQTINGASTYVLRSRWARVRVKSDGNNWVIIESSERKGTTTSDSAPAGDVGELISNTVANTSVALTTDTAANITSISLTAGDWDVSGCVQFKPAGTTTQTRLIAAISTNSATIGGTAEFEHRINATLTTGELNSLPVAPVRVSISGTTTVYLVGLAAFGTSTMTAGGIIRARRVR